MKGWADDLKKDGRNFNLRYVDLLITPNPPLRHSSKYKTTKACAKFIVMMFIVICHICQLSAKMKVLMYLYFVSAPNATHESKRPKQSRMKSFLQQRSTQNDDLRGLEPGKSSNTGRTRPITSYLVVHL